MTERVIVGKLRNTGALRLRVWGRFAASLGVDHVPDMLVMLLASSPTTIYVTL